MNHTTRRVLALTAALVMAAGAAAANAAPPPDKGGGKGGGGGPGSESTGIVLALDHSSATLQIVSPNGAGTTPLLCGGNADLSHDVVAGARWLIYSKELPEGRELVVLDYADAVTGDCNEVVVTDFAGSLVPMQPRWSPDGSRVAFVGHDPVDVTYDLWIADVATTGGIDLVNERELVADAQPLGAVSWSRASGAIAYSRLGPNGFYSIYVADPDTGTELLVTPDADQHEFHPAFSPVDYRIAFMRITDGAAVQRHDVFVGWLEGEPDGFQWQAITGVEQVTRRKTMNVAQASHPAWSPNGSSIVLSAWESAISGDKELYVVSADGKGKAKELTGPADGDRFETSVWRTEP